MEKINWKSMLKSKHIFSIGVILLVGAVLILSGGKGDDGKKELQTLPSLPTEISVQDTEKRLEKILSQIRGVGTVDVLITYDGTGKRSYVRDVSREQSKGEDKSNSAESTSVVTAKDTPVLEAEVYPRVRGVLVVAQGAESAGVCERIVRAVKAALDVEEHRIGVFAK